jgi:hypothetical protein
VIAREIELCECRFVTIVIDIVHDGAISFPAVRFPLDVLGAFPVAATAAVGAKRPLKSNSRSWRATNEWKTIQRRRLC